MELEFLFLLEDTLSTSLDDSIEIFLPSLACDLIFDFSLFSVTSFSP